MTKNDIAVGSELIAAELRWLATNAVNTPVGKTPADTLIEVGAKVIFDENGPLYNIFVGETKGFDYFQVENGE